MQRILRNTRLVLSVLICLSFFLQGSRPAAAQTSGDVRTQHNARTGKLSFIGAPAGRPIRSGAALAPGLSQKDRALEMIRPYAADFGLQQADRELRVKTTETADTRQITRFQQVYQDTPVMGGELVVNATKQGEMLSISGEIAPDLTVDTKPSIPAGQAVQTALQSVARARNGQPADFQATQPELWVYDPRLLAPQGSGALLVWRMDVTGKDPAMPVRELVLVDAQRGNVVLHFNQIDSGFKGRPGVANTARPSPAATATWPVYFNLALDEARGWIYGSDQSGNKVDVISMSTLQLVKSFTLVNGAAPAAVALSPDGTQLAIAENGASSILFLNPDTGATLGTVIPAGTSGPNKPWDVVFGRAGRLYSTGNPGSSGFDYIHAINTTTHAEVGKSSVIVRMGPKLAIAPDNNRLYVEEGGDLYAYDVSSDTPTMSINRSGMANVGQSIVLDPVEDLIFGSSGNVATTDLKYIIGRSGLIGGLTYVPTHHAVAVATNGSVVFVSATNFYPLSTYSLAVGGATLGPIASKADGSRLFVSTSAGVVAVNLSSFPPGTPGTYPSAPPPYVDLVADDAHGVLYGSNKLSHAIDVISMSTLQVVNQVHLVNGAAPMGMDLSDDGSELAVAESGASSIAFIDTSSLTVTASARVFPQSTNLPFDVVYGRAGRAYSSGSPYSGGFDYIHVIDTATHTEIAKSNYIIRAYPRLQVTSDGHYLYATEGFSPNQLFRFDVSTDTIPNPIQAPFGAASGADFVLLADQSKLFMDTGQVWNASLTGMIGSFSASGSVAEAPSLDAVAAISQSVPGLITFVNRATFYTVGSLTLPGISDAGPGAVNGDSSALFVSTDTGVKRIALSRSAPSIVTIAGGNGQAASPLAAFPAPLQVLVANMFGQPLSGIQVVFTAPASGPSGTFTNGTNTRTVTTGADGIATSGTFTANAAVGGYSVLAAVSGFPTPAAFALANASTAIRTYTAAHGTTLPGQFVCDLTHAGCTDGTDPDADYAEQYALNTYAYYFAHFQRNSLNDAALTLISTVHYGTNYPNAFWDGSQMVYGDGFPSHLDVVAHELTHGVTQYSSNLFSIYQSGAINESMSDVMGELIQRAYQGTGDNWLVGEGLSGVTRSMSDPTLYGDPDKMSSPYYNYDPNEADYGGIHSNNGISNKAAYLMAAGGTFNGYTVAPLGDDKTAAIYYEADRHLLTSGADYADLYVDLYQACVSLVGGAAGMTLPDCQSVQNAVNAVEMNLQPQAGYNTDAPLCDSGAPASYQFYDGFESGLGNWTVSNARWQVDSSLGQFAHTGAHSLYADDYPAQVTDATISMKNGAVLPANAYLHFAQAYDFEFYGGSPPWYDGGVLEYSANGGGWTDAGSLMDINGYRGLIESGYSNPFGGRWGFVGASHGYISTRLNLSSLAGQTVKFRWRMGLDVLGYNLGWWVDDVRIYSCTPPASVDVAIGGASQGGYSVPSGTSQRHSYTSVNNGPVQVKSTNHVLLVASERVAYTPDSGSTWTSYGELMGLPASQLTDTYYFPWYNSTNLSSQISVGNVGTASTTVTVSIAGSIVDSYVLAANASKRVKYPGLNDGPVVVHSSGAVPVIASERISYTPDGTNYTSYSELMGLPASQLTDTYYFSYYNSLNLSEQISVANVGSSSTTVTVTIGGNVVDSYALDPNASRRVKYPGLNTGPVVVHSTGGVPIISSERISFTPDAGVTYTGYSEMMGLPAARLTDTYAFPWYNSVDNSMQVSAANVGSGPTTVTVTINGTVMDSYALAQNASKRVKYMGINNGPVVVHSSGGIPIIASERTSYTPDAGVTYPSFSEMLGLPSGLLTDTYVFPWYNNVNLNTQLRFGVP